ncbi:Phragmoplast-associated kinesin-related protein 2 [Hibiscus trionum]|uniref:Kinesin-like protein KIN-10A n=1 Tax=Hibiscus trionum TaxID=183268 RepID=A0A9W7LHC6_HIBTR|nr:Phragmoplast-associated kinesin-related protein 2 [Hibiscus trionum]
MAPTPSSTSKQTQTQIRTPQSKHRLNFNSARNNNNPAIEQHHPPGEHPVEAIGRIRNHPGEQKDKNPVSYLHINPDNKTLRVRADIGYRDFTLDGISSSEEEDLDTFYKKFVQSRINGVKMGAKCTIMMYGPTGAGKSHTMFGCSTSKQSGIVYKSLKDILGDHGEDDGGGERLGIGTFVQVSVLEIYNEEIYDLLSSNGGGGFGIGWPKGNGSKVKLEVMGKKAKNATFISGSEAGKISKEIQKVEKRRIVKSTLCNERSSRSHCMIILDVPTVGGRLMLVDMAGSENIDQAGQVGFEAKMQTAKINQGNIALKRVVESIANGDSHVPFRDSKLTMLLQDSFEDDQSKILMILCASPDPKELHKTICTLEYGAKAKCIVRGPHTPLKDKNEDPSSAVNLGSRLAAMDQFINKLQLESKQREKEKDEARKALEKKEEEVAALRSLLEVKGSGSGVTEDEINLKVNERTQMLKLELEKKLDECKRMAEEFVEMERRRMEERILQQQEEVEMLRKRLQEIEFELRSSRNANEENESSNELDGSSFAKRLVGIYGDEVPGMVMSMELDMNDPEPFIHDVKHTDKAVNQSENDFAPQFGAKPGLTTVYEEEETEEEDEEVEKVIIEEKRICSNEKAFESMTHKQPDSDTSRLLRIQNIFTLCGNQRELSQQTITPAPAKSALTENIDPHWSSVMVASDDSVVKSLNKENQIPSDEYTDGQIDVYVKWESSKENPGKFITTLKVTQGATLADLRKLIDIYLDVDNQPFTFLVLGDPTGATVPKENEAIIKASKLPICNNGYLACLRPTKGLQITNHLPLSPLQLTPLPLTPLENKLPLTASTRLSNQGDNLSPKLSPHLSTTPFITAQRRC